MKTHKLFVCSLALALFAAAAARGADATNSPDQATPPAATATPTPETSTAAAAAPDQTPQPPAETPAETAGQPATPTPAPVPSAIMPVANTNAIAAAAPGATQGLHLNFRGVPLEMVLNYMSEAAGFIIVLDTDVKGKVDVWSDQPLSKQEAVDLLKVMLEKNGYTALQDGRTLTIVRSDDAKKKDVPVHTGNNPDLIPKSSDIVTQIIPVRSLNAVQLAKDLATLLPTDTMIANESGNALVMTDTQTNIRRITEIIKALDSVSFSVNSIRVFSLKYADAKDLSDLIKELFPAPNATGTTGNNNNGGFGRFRGGGGGGFGGFGGGGGGGGGNDATDTGNGHTPSTRVTAVADQHSNSLIVSAPDDLMPTVEALVASVDTSVEDVTEVRVFHLKNADPGEMSDLLSNLFPDDTTTPATGAGRTAAQFTFGGFRGPFGFPGQQNNAGATTESDRMKKLGRVLAVPDRRTASVVVSTSKDLMPQIASMIEQLDENPAKKQKVFVYSLENADVQDVQQVLQDLFPASSNSRNGSSGSSSTANANPLTTRSQSLEQQQNSSATTGTSSGGIGSAGRGN